jgi:hypothetical protein
VYELIPIVSGVAAGALAAAFLHGRARIVLIGVVALVAGVVAAVVSGEAAKSWGFVLWDTGQALAAGALSLAAMSALAGRRLGRHGQR